MDFSNLPMYGIFNQSCTIAALGSLIVILAIGYVGSPLIVWALAILAILYGFAAPAWLILAALIIFLIFIRCLI